MAHHEERCSRILVEFAYRHLDFQVPELESVLSLLGVSIMVSSADTVQSCRRVDLPSSHVVATKRRPFVVLELPSQLVEKVGLILLERCTLVRSVLELWGMGRSLQECASAAEDWSHTHPHRLQQYANESWKITVQTLGSKYTREEQDAMRAHFALKSLKALKGPVQLKNPTNEFVIVHEVELDANGGTLLPRRNHKGELVNPDRPPVACYFGPALGGTRKKKGRADLEQFSLKRRTYLGPTSMDAELSFIMASLGRVQPGSIVLDPFVGTGSILLSCALRGAYCIGSDIDIRVLRGRSHNENVTANFRQFNLPRPELVRSDNAIYHRHYRRHRPLYDAIVCDPPYGIRAGARKCGSRLEEPRAVLEEHRHDHIAQTKTLVKGGRLVYIIPSFADFDPNEDLPRHPCLKPLYSCFQPLSSDLGRRVVAMEKEVEYDASRRQEYLASTWKNDLSAEKVANIRSKLIEAAKGKPRYEERAAARKQKRQEHREAKKRAKVMLRV